MLDKVISLTAVGLLVAASVANYAGNAELASSLNSAATLLVGHQAYQGVSNVRR